VPINLWNELFAALHDDCRIIMIGDINQLPPVQGRSVLGFAMTYWPTFELTKIHRQAEGNPIIANAHNILNGRMIKPAPGKVDRVDMPASGSETLNKLVATVKLLHKNGQFDPLTDAIVVPQNKGMIGQLHINEKLVHYFNPPKYENGVLINKRTVIKTGMQDAIFAAGDKVMLLANDRELGLTNGMIGWVESIVPNGLYNGKFMAHDETIGGDEEPFELDAEDLQNFVDDFKEDEEDDENKRQASHIMSVRFSDEIVVPFSTAGAFRKVTHAYACTCHKMQGGEAPTVLILAHQSNSKMLSREWLYTAFTRARERVILLANDRGLMTSISNQRIKGRTLEEKTRSFMLLQDQKDVAIPDLPDPRKVEAA
jgi:exodeoxyribonuclease V alpha subunit